jgi:hypothetical protein
MSVPRAFAVAAAVATAAGMTAAIGFAGPARADQVLEGIFTYSQGDITVDMTITPSCVPTVGDLRDNLQLPVACRLHVVPASASKVVGGDARLVGGQWEYTTNRKDGLTCPDGITTESVLETYRFDDQTLAGTRSVAYSDGCDGRVAASIVKTPFTLAYKAPLPIPNNQYPLICEPGGLKRCF